MNNEGSKERLDEGHCITWRFKRSSVLLVSPRVEHRIAARETIWDEAGMYHNDEQGKESTTDVENNTHTSMKQRTE